MVAIFCGFTSIGIFLVVLGLIILVIGIFGLATEGMKVARIGGRAGAAAAHIMGPVWFVLIVLGVIISMSSWILCYLPF
jgi:hypothetical protein